MVMQLGDIRIPRGLLVSALLLFFLPFITIACGGQQISLTGMQLMSGGSTFGESQSPQPDVVLAFLAGLIALGATWIRGRFARPVTALFAGSAFGWLQFFKFRLDLSLTQSALGPITVSYNFGFWLVNLLLLATAALSVWLVVQERQVAPAAVEPLPAGDMPTAGALIEDTPPSATLDQGAIIYETRDNQNSERV